MVLVGYADFLTDPLGPPTLTLLVIIVFIMWHIFRRRMDYSIAAMLLAMWAAGWVYILFVGLPAAASSWPRSAAVSWWGPTWWWWGRAATVTLPAPLPVLLAPSCLVSCLCWTLAVGRRHHAFFVNIGGCISWWRLLYQLLKPLYPHSDYVSCIIVFWRCRLLAIALFIRCRPKTHHIDDGVGIMHPIIEVWPTIPSAESSNKWCSRTRLICLISVTADFYS